MTGPLTEEELATELYFHTNPLSQIQELEHEWLLGTWTLSKSHRTWRVGYAHPLVTGARLRTFLFDTDGQARIGVLFESAGEPPWQMLGWVPAARGDEANQWVCFLNDEIEKRLANDPAGANTTYDPHDGSKAADIEDEIAERKFKASVGVKPFRSKPN